MTTIRITFYFKDLPSLVKIQHPVSNKMQTHLSVAMHYVSSG